jgi:hypothetical protein
VSEHHNGTHTIERLWAKLAAKLHVRPTLHVRKLFLGKVEAHTPQLRK